MAITFEYFLERLGNLHDCQIVSFEWFCMERIVELHIEDIAFNYEGYVGYDPIPGRIFLFDIDQIVADVEYKAEIPKIMEFTLKDTPDGRKSATIHLWPSGSICLRFLRANFPELPSVAR